MNPSQKIKTLCLVTCSLALAACASKEVIRTEPAVSPVPAASPATGPAGETARTATPPAAAPTQTQAGAAATKTDRESARPAAIPSLQTVYFAFDSSTLSQASRDELDKNFAMLQNEKNLRISIEGHCDERGSGEYNLALGERRAKAAKDYLVTRGIGADRIATVSYGNERPAVAGHDEASWAKNRRDEFVPAK